MNQVPMTGFDIYCIKPGLLCQAGSFDKSLLQSFQFIIAEYNNIFLIFIQVRIVNCGQGRGFAMRLGICLLPIVKGFSSGSIESWKGSWTPNSPARFNSSSLDLNAKGSWLDIFYLPYKKFVFSHRGHRGHRVLIKTGFRRWSLADGKNISIASCLVLCLHILRHLPFQENKVAQR